VLFSDSTRLRYAVVAAVVLILGFVIALMTQRRVKKLGEAAATVN
jgi:HAMP domain-containing protein